MGAKNPLGINPTRRNRPVIMLVIIRMRHDDDRPDCRNGSRTDQQMRKNGLAIEESILLGFSAKAGAATRRDNNQGGEFVGHALRISCISGVSAIAAGFVNG